MTAPPFTAMLFRSPVQERQVEKDPISRLVEAYPGLRWLLRRHTQNPADADDILNQASVLALDRYRAGQLSDPRRICGFVYRAALNLYRNYVRALDNRSDLRISEADMNELPNAAAAADESFGARFAALVADIISELPTPRDREIIVRLYLEEESKESICKSLHLSSEHFDRVASRTRQRLRVLLEREGITREVLRDA